MAGNAIIGALRVVLGIESAALETGLKQAQSTLGKFSKGVGNVSAELFNLRNAFAVVAATAMVSFVKKATDAGDEIAKTAKKVDVTTDSLQELRFAASLSGTKTEEFDAALLQLNKRLGDVNGGVTEAAVALGKLGLSIADVKGKGTDEVFKLIADRLNQVRDPMERARLATELYGKAGQQLLPTIAEGSAGLARMAAEAHRLGLVLDTETLKKAEEANDEFTRIGNALKIAGVNIAVGFLPALENLRKEVTSKEFQDGVKTLGGNFASLISTLVEHKSEIEMIAITFAGLRLGMAFGGAFGKQGAAIGGLLGGLAGLAAGFELVGTEATQLERKLNLLQQQKIALGRELISTQDPAAVTTITGKIELLDKSIAETVDRLAGLKKVAAEEAPKPAQVTVNAPIIQNLPQVNQAVTDLTFKTRILNDEFIKLAPGFAEAAHGLKVFGNTGFETQTQVALLHPQLQQLNQALLMFKGAQLTQEVMPAWQLYEQQIARIQQLFDAGAISSDTYARAMRAAAEKSSTSWNIAGASIAGSFASIAGSFGQSNSAMATAGKAFAIVQAIISTYTGMAKALELPFPANLAAVAAVAAQGFSFVASIKSQAVPKFAQGGSFTVPGGMSMTDNIVMPIGLASGERVSVDRADNFGSGGGSKVLQIEGIDPKQYYRGDVLRDLLDNARELINDGYKFA